MPRTFIFAGKAAPGYLVAKSVIKLINTLGKAINDDPAVNGRIKVVFIENYGVSLAELIIPAADVSEQISTAGTEASGTSNMKLMMNGAFTVGTADGANIEIMEAVGPDFIGIFGLSADEVRGGCQGGGCDSLSIYKNDAGVRRIVDQLVDGSLPAPAEEFRALHNYLVYDEGGFAELRDFAAYLAVQARVDELYRDRGAWWRMITRNIARSGAFSSDYTVTRYAAQIWGIRPVKIDAGTGLGPAGSGAGRETPDMRRSIVGLA